MADRYDEHLARVLREGWPQPRPGMEARLTAALAGVRPRRRPTLVTVIVVTLIVLALAAATYAAVRFFVKGRLHAFDVTWRPEGRWGPTDTAQSFQGELQSQTGEKASRFPDADISPDGTQVLFGDDELWPSLRDDLFRANLDGSDQVNLTQLAGVGGINCVARWSPDGRMIAFTHSDPAKGQLPCQAGFQVWVMSSDGTGARRVMPDGSPSAEFQSWTPDGNHLLVAYVDHHEPEAGHPNYAECQVLLTDLEGRNATPIPNVGHSAAYSPDGSMIASSRFVPAVKDGRPGCFSRLLLTNADGSDPRVLVEQFIADADIAKRYPTPEQRATPGASSFNWILDVHYVAGPRGPMWSPDGKCIAFLAALPYDPDGIFYRNQTEIWVYDLTTDALIRMTHDQADHTGLTWKK